MSDEHAFALKDAYAEDGDSPFAGATMAYGPNGETADLGAMLEEGGGFILTSDPRLIGALRDNEAFKGATKADAEAAGAEVLTPNADGSPPTPDEEPEEGEVEPDRAPPPEPQPAEPVDFEKHSLEDLRAAYASELNVAEGDVPENLNRRQLADAINQSRESRGAVGGGE